MYIVIGINCRTSDKFAIEAEVGLTRLYNTVQEAVQVAKVKQQESKGGAVYYVHNIFGENP